MTHNKPENRIGRFTIFNDILRNGWHDLLPLMGNFVVVQTQIDLAMNTTEYVAYSPMFDVIEEFSSAPRYELTIAQMPDGPAIIKAQREP